MQLFGLIHSHLECSQYLLLLDIKLVCFGLQHFPLALASHSWNGPAGGSDLCHSGPRTAGSFLSFVATLAGACRLRASHYELSLWHYAGHQHSYLRSDRDRWADRDVAGAVLGTEGAEEVREMVFECHF